MLILARMPVVGPWTRSLQSLTQHCVGGLATLNMQSAAPFVRSTALCVGVFGPSYASVRNARAMVERIKTINAGQMHSSRHMGFSPFMKPVCRRANPDEETTDWRAVCGRTACTVRRAGRRNSSRHLSSYKNFHFSDPLNSP